MTRRFLTILAIASLLVLTVASPAAAGRRWDKPAPAINLDDGRGVCDSSVKYVQAHTNSSPTISRSGASANFNLDQTSLHLGFEPCYDVAGGAGDLNGGSFGWVGLYARSGSIGGCIAGSIDDCAIYFGVASCHWDAPQRPCYREFVDPTPDYRAFLYISSACGYQSMWYDLGATDTTPAIAMYLDANQNFIFNVDGVTKKVISKNASNIACWASSGNRGAMYGFSRWDNHDSIGHWNSTGSRLLSAAYGVENQGWTYTNWGNGACQYQAPDGDCVILSSSELRAQSQ